MNYTKRIVTVSVKRDSSLEFECYQVPVAEAVGTGLGYHPCVQDNELFSADRFQVIHVESGRTLLHKCVFDGAAQARSFLEQAADVADWTVSMAIIERVPANEVARIQARLWEVVAELKNKALDEKKREESANGTARTRPAGRTGTTHVASTRKHAS